MVSTRSDESSNKEGSFQVGKETNQLEGNRFRDVDLAAYPSQAKSVNR